MGVKMFITALIIGGVGGIAPDIDHILFGGRADFHDPLWLGTMGFSAFLLCFGLYLAFSRRLS